MRFRKEEIKYVISELIAVGWNLNRDTIFAPSGGIWFNESHFNDWGPSEMLEIIGNRGKKIELAKNENWNSFSKEHYQLCDVIEKMIRDKSGD